MSDQCLTLNDLMHEDTVYEKWPGLFADKELREARKTRVIEWFALRKGPHYTEAQLAAYLARRIQKPCEKTGVLEEVKPERASSKSAANGSAGSKKAGLSIVTGMTPELAGLAAKAFEPRT
jgi:hypothetical protein